MTNEQRYEGVGTYRKKKKKKICREVRVALNIGSLKTDYRSVMGNIPNDAEVWFKWYEEE